MQSEAQRVAGIHKFISLMEDLTQFIQQDPSHQQTIYEYLNSQQLKRLFESIHDQDHHLRITAIKFICHLLNNNQHIIQLMSKLSGCELTTGIRKIIGGLDYYKAIGCDFKRNHVIKQPEVVSAFSKLKYQPSVMAWAVDAKTYKVSYYVRNSLTEPFPFDPKHHIVGIFIRNEQHSIEKEKRASITSANEKSRYKISKK